MLHAVRALEDDGDREIRDGVGLGIAHQGGELDGLAGTIGAALGHQIDIERLRRGPTRDAAIAQIEGGLGEVEKAVVAVRTLGDQDGRGVAAGTAQQTGLEAGMTLGVGGRLAQDVVVERDQAQRRAGDRLGARERAHQGVQTVVAREARKPEIRDQEPLGRERFGLLHGVVGPGGHGVDAGAQVLDQLADRHRGGDLAIEPGIGRGLDLDMAVPDRLPGAIGDLVRVPGGELLAEPAARDRRAQGAVADAIDRRVDPIGVHRDDRDRRIAARRQHIGTPEETDHGRAIAHEDVEIRRLGERLAVRRRESGADLDTVARAVLDAVDTDLPGLDLDRQIGAVGHPHEIGELAPVARQRVAELQTDAGARGVRVDLVSGDPEAVLADHVVVFGADGGVLDQREGGAQGADCRAPVVALGECSREDSQGIGALGDRCGAPIGVDGRCGRVPLEGLPRLPIGGRGGHRRAGEIEPEAAVVGGKSKGCGVEVRRALGVVRGGPPGLGSQRRERRMGGASAMRAASFRAASSSPRGRKRSSALRVAARSGGDTAA